MTATLLQRLHIAFVAILVLGSFGGWAISFFDEPGHGQNAMWVLALVAWFGSSLFLGVLGIAVERACKVRERAWFALALASCVPVVRVFVEVHMVQAMARTAGTFVDDARIAPRVWRLMIARVLVGVSQYVAPFILVVTAQAPGGELVAVNWMVVMGAISFTTIMLLVIATHAVVAPVVEALRNAARPNVGGAGAQESVAVRTL